MSLNFHDYQAILLDLDGTIYHEEQCLPGAADLVARLQAARVKFACLSNSTASPVQLVERLARMQINVDPDHIYTAAAAAADHALQTYTPSRFGGNRPRIFNLATEGIQSMLEGQVQWVKTGGEPCDVVIVGTPTNVYATEERQRIALQLLRKGAHLVGISADRVYPSPRGIEFGSGAFSWMLGYAADIEPFFAGKPQRAFFRHLCQRLNVAPEWCLLVGDNLEADIAGGKSMGMRTVLTLTGVTRRRDLRNVAPGSQPDLVIEDLTELL